MYGRLFRITMRLAICMTTGLRLRSLQLFPRAQSPDEVIGKLREELQTPEQPRVSDQQHIGAVEGILTPSRGLAFCKRSSQFVVPR